MTERDFWQALAVGTCVLVIALAIFFIFLIASTKADAYSMTRRGRIDPASITCQDVRTAVASYGVDGLKAMARANGIQPTPRQIRSAQACMGQR